MKRKKPWIPLTAPRIGAFIKRYSCKQLAQRINDEFAAEQKKWEDWHKFTDEGLARYVEKQLTTEREKTAYEVALRLEYMQEVGRLREQLDAQK